MLYSLGALWKWRETNQYASIIVARHKSESKISSHLCFDFGTIKKIGVFYIFLEHCTMLSYLVRVVSLRPAQSCFIFHELELGGRGLRELVENIFHVADIKLHPKMADGMLASQTCSESLDVRDTSVMVVFIKNYY